MKLWISIFFLFGLNACAASGTQRVPLSAEFKPGEQFMQIRLLGTVVIPTQEVNGESMSELSGLAWDEDENRLYAVSDKGVLFHLQPLFSEGLLSDIKVHSGYPLRNEHGKKLKGKKDDSEGLAILNGNNGKQGDTELLISFEIKPRIKRYATNGYRTGSIPLPPILRKIKHYRAANKGLESVSIHPHLGILTVPEASLKNSSQAFPTFYSTSGKQWKLPKRSSLKSAIVGTEVFPDGSILALERTYSSLVEPAITSLRRIHLNKDCESDQQQSCPTEVLATLSTADGWSIDNFEGLTHYRGNRFFMVSDNNDFWLQRTLLSYFEVIIP